jgi:uncharacterized protein YjbI with pentapeptide repeats
MHISLRPAIRRLTQHSKLLAGIAAGLMVGGAASAAVLASIPGANGVIHGCYRTNNGTLRIIDDTTETCAGNETAISWNQQGPAGPQGPSGSVLRSNLVGADLRSAVMVYWDLSNLDLTGANFGSANLSGALFSGATLDGANFNGAKLSMVDLSGHDLSAVDLRGADLTEADLSNTNIQSGKDFTGVVFNDTQLDNISLVGAVFSDASFAFQNLSSRDLSGASFAGGYPESSRLTEIGSSIFDGANLTDADFSCAQTTNSSFASAVMVATLWDNTCLGDNSSSGLDGDMTNANLTSSVFRNINLEGSNFTGAVLMNVTWDNVICPDGTDSVNNGNTCVGHL